MSYHPDWDSPTGPRLPELSEQDRKALARLLDVEGRGDGTTHKGFIDGQLVRGSCALVDYAGVVELVQRRRAEDRARASKGPGGRPTVYADTDRIVIVLQFVLARLGRATQIEEMRKLVTSELTKESLKDLGLPETESRVTKRAIYDRLLRAWHRLAKVVDPKPGATGERRTRYEVDEVFRKRDPQDSGERQELLDIVSNRLLEASWHLLPAEVRARWTGNIALDASPVFVWGRGHTTDPKKTQPSDSMSPEIDGGWYMVKEDGRETLRWAWAVHIGVTVPDPYSDEPFPLLALGIRVDTPNKRAGENSVAIVKSIVERGHRSGYLMTDRGYFGHALYEDFNKPITKIGYKIVGDYKTEGKQSQLGIQGQQNGAVQASGMFLCPSAGEDMLELDKMEDRPRKWRAYQAKKAQQLLHAFRRKDGNQYHCPAMGPGATAVCTARPDGPLSLGMPRLGQPHVVIDPGLSKEELPACCTGGSVALSPEKNQVAKLLQDVPFRSQKWEDLWDLRGRVEGYNGYMKDEKHADIESAHNRRVRGFGASALTLALQVLATNVRKVESFLKAESPEWEPARPRPTRFGFTRAPEWARGVDDVDDAVPSRGDPPPVAA